MYVEHPKPPIPAGYEQIEADPITAASMSVPTDARYALIKIASAAGRYRDDGTNPTSASGYPLAVGDTLELTSSKQLSSFKIICQSDDETVIDVVYYKLSG